MFNATATYPFLRSNQSMAALIGSFNWEATTLGAIDNWPDALKAAIGICLNSTNPVLILWGPDFIQLYNDSYKQLIGDKKESALGQASKKTWPEAWHVIEPILAPVYYEGQSVNVEDQHFPINRHGFVEDTYFTTSYMPLISNNSIEGIFVTSRETTDRFLYSKKIQANEQYVREIFMQAPMGIGIFEGMNMKITMANAEILKLWRRDDSIIGKDLIDALPEIRDQKFLELLQSVFVSGKPFYAYETLAQLEHDGKLNDHYFNFVYAPVKEGNATVGVMAVATEVTSQVEAKKELIQSEKRFRNLIEEAPMATAMYLGRELKIEVVNDQMLSYWGKDKSILGKTFEEAIPELKGQPFLDLLDNVYTSGEPYHADMQSAVLRINGELKQSWFNFTYKPLHDAEGKVYGILHMAVDVSKQVQLQEQKDEFLGIASHELKTPVTSIKAYAQVLHQMMKDTNHTQETHMLYRMDKQINKLTNLVENLLDVTKIQAGKLEFDEINFDFNALVKEVVTDMQAIITSHNIQLQPDETANVFADKERIEQVLTNLILNAAKYSPQANVILVRTKKENDSIFCFIEDKGIGIPQENLGNIFDRFYQVSRNNPTRFSGLGLGLYISAEIIRRSNGSINVVSKEGEGSTFSFSLKTVS